MATLRQPIATKVPTATRFRELMRLLSANRPNDDLGIVEKAYEFSQKNHAGQLRASGQPYVMHPLEVSCVLAEMKMDPVAIAAGLHHDSGEDTSVTIVDIRKELGEQVAHIVEGVTKIGRIDFSSREEQQDENLRKMMLAMVDDIRVVLIKLADRLHNMRTLEHLPAERQQRIARETLDIYAPIAHRLGMGKIRGELEDLGFRYVDPIGYQQLHEAVESRRKPGEQFLSNIEEMHKMAEEGIAAHWKYKDGPVSAKDEQRLAWLRQVVEWQRDVSDPSEFLSTLKIDLYPEEVYTFTPKGKVVILPRDATPVDFAYSIHTEVGQSCVGAKVNGRMVPLRYKLHSGDMVEILTQPGHHPSRDWLAIVKSSRARNKIKHWLNVHQRERAIEIGRKLIEKEARKYRIALKDLKEEAFQRAANDYGLGKPDDLLAGIGYGKYSARQALAKLVPAATDQPGEADEEKHSAISNVVRRVFGGDHNAISVKGHDDLLVYRARCCNPIRGEDIVGYVTRGKGVAVHSRNCPNVTNLMYESERRIAVEWARQDGAGAAGYPVKLTLFCDDRAGMLKQITAVISDDNTNIRNIEARTANSQASIDVVIDIDDLKHLERIIVGLRNIAGVHDVQRVQKI